MITTLWSSCSFYGRVVISLYGRSGCRLDGMRLPQLESLGLVQPADKAQEWWVTLDGRRVVGFSGHTAQQRAAKYFRELTSIAEGVHPWQSADPAFNRRGV